MFKIVVIVVLIFSFFSKQSFAEVSATNSIYTLYVENVPKDGGVGTFTVATGASHPFPNENVLYDGNTGNARTTYLTVRSYTSGTDYVSTYYSPNSPFTVVRLDNFSPAVSHIGSTGYTTTWNIIGRDTLNIQQVTNIEGTALHDSRVRVTTMVTNIGQLPVHIGIRYMWDWMIDGSDDARIRIWNPTDPGFISTFFEEVYPLFEYYEMINDTSTFSVFGTVSGSPLLSPPPTPPHRLNYSHWPYAYINAWTFTVTGSDKDTAICYFWGDTAENSIKLEPGESYTVTEYLTTVQQSIQSTQSTQIPTLTGWGMLVMSALFVASLYFMKRRITISHRRRPPC